jgi:anti-sigma factor RsiW
MSCASPIPFEALIAYWLGELPAADEEPLEAHFFGCAHCTRRLEELAAIAAGIRSAVRAGAVTAVISAPFVELMKKEGLRIREYRVAAGGRADCTIRADDDAVVGRMRAPLAGVRRIDALQTIEAGGERGPEMRLEDVPFDPAAGEVLYFPSAAWLKGMPAHTAHLRLVAVDEGGERELGQYTFAHTTS